VAQRFSAAIRAEISKTALAAEFKESLAIRNAIRRI
jgi:hypothetical protein